MAADIHLDVGSKTADVLWALDVLRLYAAEQDIDTAIILGDLFHDRESVPIDAMCEAYLYFIKCKETGLNWIGFPGNHDMFQKHSWDFNSLRIFSKVMTVINGVKLLALDGRRFWILPFVYSESAYMEILGEIEKQYQSGDVLLTHIGVRSAELNRCFLLQDWSHVDFTKSKFDRVYTGHFHLHQQVGDNVWYPGSIIPFKFDEGDSSHGFLVYDLITRQHELIDIWEAGKRLKPDTTPPPQFCTYLDSLLGSKREEDVSNNMVRIMLTQETNQHERDTIRTKMMDLGARQVTFLENYEKEDEEATPCDDAVPLEHLFSTWIDANPTKIKHLNRGVLLRMDAEVRQLGDEIYAKQITT